MATTIEASLMQSRANALSWLALSAAMIALDQLSKWLAVANLQFQQPVSVIPGFWNWTLTHNTGAAFSFLASAGGWQHGFFIALALLISTVLVVGLKRTARHEWRTALPFALIIAGALGNVIDRIRFGYVIDFVQWYWKGFYWPVFNVADSCIVVGAMLMLLFSFQHDRKGKLP
jgi:signal peptidase II